MENQIAVSVLLLVIGGIITLIFTKVSNKTAALKYFIETNKIGISTDDEVFGSVRSTWQGHEVRNLHYCTIEVQNSTSKDFEDIKLKVYTGNETYLLNQRTELVDTPYAISWDDSFNNKITIAEGGEATKDQIALYRHNREYKLEALNRGQKVRLSYLCTNPNNDDTPRVEVTTPSKGVKLVRRSTPSLVINPIFGTPVASAISRALILSVLVVLLTGVWVENVWVAAGFCMFFGLTGQIFGALCFKIETVIKNIVAG